MHKSTAKIVFIGTPEFGAIVLEGLINGGYKPVLVVTAPDKPIGRKQTITPPPVKALIMEHKTWNIPILQPEKLDPDFMLQVSRFMPDLIIVAAYGQILPKEILDIPKYGCLNVHPSLLPKYRGPSPIQTTILNGDKETGVTIMKMDEKLDHGEIISNSTFPFKKITYPELHNKLAKLGVKLLIDTIPKWVAGEIKAKSQDESKAFYTKLIKKEDGLIDWKNTAEYIERQVRALNPWPGTYTLYKDKKLKILKAEKINDKLIIKEVQLEGKKPMKFEEFLRGHKDYIMSC